MLTKTLKFNDLTMRCRTFAAPALCGLAGLLATAGCTPKSPSDPAAKDGRTSPAAAVTVHLGFFPNVTHAAALIGTGRGTFAKSLAAKNATVDEKTFTAGPAEMEALFAEAVDIGFVGPGPAVNAYLKSGGKALQIIAGASSGGAGLVSRSDAGFSDFAGLKGKRVAVPQTGGTQDVSLRHFLTESGLSPKNKGGDVDVVQYAPADIAALFDRKELDAAYLPEPWLSVLEQKNAAHLILDEREKWPGKRFATTVVVVRSEFLTAHPDLVAAFLDAHVENVRWANAHEDEARALVGKRIKEITTRTLPDAVLKSALSRTEITADPLPQTVLTFAQWAKALGYQRGETVPLQKLFALDALNAALAARKLPPVAAPSPAP